MMGREIADNCSNLSVSDKRVLVEAFKIVDIDGSGCLNDSEACIILKLLGREDVSSSRQ